MLHTLLWMFYLLSDSQGLFGAGVDVNDILNRKLLPVDVFLKHSRRYEIEPLDIRILSDVENALHTMDFHRNMMQQFMASGYLAKQMLNGNTGNKFIEKRIGRANNESMEYMKSNLENTSSLHTPVGSVQKLLYDDGSAQYKAWLDRTTTLEDIQRQMSISSHKSPIRRHTINSDLDLSGASYGEEDIDEGDITGYAYNGEQNASIGNNFLPHPGVSLPQWPLYSPSIGPIMKQINKNGYESAYEDYVVHSSPPEHSHAVVEPPQHKKEISIKDITDIALTTLAFLSFGMFILQVLMCITMSKDDSSNLMMLPMEAQEANDTIDGTEEIRRRRRSVELYHEEFYGINELSRLVLDTIDGALTIDSSKGNMTQYYKYLCDYSIFGRTQLKHQPIWMPLWSLGTSWFAARLANDSVSMIKSLGHLYSSSCTK